MATAGQQRWRPPASENQKLAARAMIQVAAGQVEKSDAECDYSDPGGGQSHCCCWSLQRLSDHSGSSRQRAIQVLASELAAAE